MLFFFSHILSKDCKSPCLYFAVYISGLQAHICGVFTPLPRNMVSRHALGDHSYHVLSASVPPISGGCGLVAQSHLTLVNPWTIALQALLSMDSPSKNTGLGCHFLLQRIFLTQESNLGLLHCRRILY